MSDLHTAILRTVVYSDVFDFPLSAGEIQRYLEAMPATRKQVLDCLQADLVPGWLSHDQGLYYLPGRDHLVTLRQQRARQAARLWQLAWHYGYWLAQLPFIRMVAVTGALAVDNTPLDTDVDFFLVTAPGRVWTARLMTLAIVRLASLHGTTLCPNYLVSEGALNLPERGLYPARELAQMVPLYGLQVYERVRSLNSWVDELLPNATGMPYPPRPPGISQNPRNSKTGSIQPAPEPLKRTIERALYSPPFNTLEWWEMRRKQRKFSRLHPDPVESAFGPEWCKGHFDGHGRRSLQAFEVGLHELQQQTGFLVDTATFSPALPAHRGILDNPS